MAEAKKGKGEAKVAEPSKRLLFKVDGTKVQRLRRACPKCGPGVFLAEHQDRASCGRCGYTEFKKKEAAAAS